MSAFEESVETLTSAPTARQVTVLNRRKPESGRPSAFSVGGMAYGQWEGEFSLTVTSDEACADGPSARHRAPTAAIRRSSRIVLQCRVNFMVPFQVCNHSSRSLSSRRLYSLSSASLSSSVASLPALLSALSPKLSCGLGGRSSSPRLLAEGSSSSTSSLRRRLRRRSSSSLPSSSYRRRRDDLFRLRSLSSSE